MRGSVWAKAGVGLSTTSPAGAAEPTGTEWCTPYRFLLSFGFLPGFANVVDVNHSLTNPWQQGNLIHLVYEIRGCRSAWAICPIHIHFPVIQFFLLFPCEYCRSSFFPYFYFIFFSCSFESYLLEGTSSFAYLISRHCLPAFTQEMKLRSIFRTRNASEVVIRVLGSTSQYKWISRCTWRQIYLWGSVFCALHPSVSQSFFDYDETEHSRQIIAKSNLGNSGSDMVLLGQDAALTCMKYSSNSL